MNTTIYDLAQVERAIERVSKRKKNQLRRLPKMVKRIDIGNGIWVVAILVKRTTEVAMYRRTDGIYEVFKIEIKEGTNPSVRKDITYFNPRKEIYPEVEESAYSRRRTYTFDSLKKAEKAYNKLCS